MNNIRLVTALVFSLQALGCNDGGGDQPLDGGLDASDTDSGADSDGDTLSDGDTPEPEAPLWNLSSVESAEWELSTQIPPARSTHRMVYSESREEVWMFFGGHGSGPINDAWSWDGDAWAPIGLPEDEEIERKNYGIAYDPVSELVYILYGIWSGYESPGSYRMETIETFYSFDGSSWMEITVDPGPIPRAGHAMTFDEARGVVVVFGGMSADDEVLGDTWIFDGESWTEVGAELTVAPPPRLNSQMVYDPARERVVLFSGQQVQSSGLARNLDDTWEWDGVEWTEVVTDITPPGRGHHTLSYDPNAGHVLLLGGMNRFSPVTVGAVFDDFWAFDGAQWVELEPAGPRPEMRSAPWMTFDAGRGLTVMMGGQGEINELADIWEWDGEGWRERSPLPSPRSNFAFAQRPNAGDAILHGGYSTNGGLYWEDSWLFRDGTWRRLEVEDSPGRRSSTALEFDGSSFVLFGGEMPDYAATMLMDDTWTLREGDDGQWEWNEVAGDGPSAREDHAMAFHPIRDRVVLFGGATESASLNDTWEWDGEGWHEIEVASSPPARYYHHMIYDSSLDMVLVMGGSNDDTNALDDVWGWNGESWTELEDRTATPEERVWNSIAVVGPGVLLSFGGLDSGTVHNDLHVFANGEWRELETDLAPGIRFGSHFIMGRESLYLLGGSISDLTSFWEDEADFWELHIE